jgi:RNA polymerase sigma-70 factor (ECF subfamily)
VPSEDWTASVFEQHRAHLRGVAYRMLGSLSDADDAVQDAWLRFSTADTREVENVRGWLTTVVARVCLNMLRSRRTRRERPLEAALPEPIVSRLEVPDPQQEVILGEAVGMAMLIVLDSLSPAERVAFVLHDVFAIPFDDIAPIVGRSSTATRQLASRARRRVRQSTRPETDLRRQREVVDAFVRASRDGDLEALLAVLDPDVVLRVDGGAAADARSVVIRGVEAVAAQALEFRNLATFARPVLVNGAMGAVVVREGRPFSIIAFRIDAGRIMELDIVTDPELLARLDPSLLADHQGGGDVSGRSA